MDPTDQRSDAPGTAQPGGLPLAGGVPADAGASVEELRAAFEADPDNWQTASALAQCYADRGWLNQAQDVYNRVLKDNETNYSLLLDYGNVCFRRGDGGEALRVFRKLTTIKPDRVEAWNNLGIVQLKQNAVEEAREAFQRVLQLEPGNAGALLNMGNYHHVKGEIAQAVDFFKKTVAAQPDFADAWFNLGNAYLAEKDYEHAIESFEKALRYQREFPSALKNLGFACEQIDNCDRAEQNYLKALELNKADAGIYVNLGSVYSKQRKFDAAKKYYLQAVRLSPNQMPGWMGLRDLALRKGDITAYVRSTLAILQRLDGDAIAGTVGKVRELGLSDKVDELLDPADKLGKEGDLLDSERLLAYQRRNTEPGKVVAICKRLSALPHPPEQIRRCLAEYCFRKGSHDRALELLADLDEASVSGHRLRWQIQILTKQWDVAEESLRRYVEARPDCFDAWFFLAKVRAARGDEAQAEEMLMQALANGFADMALLKEDSALERIYHTLISRMAEHVELRPGRGKA